MFGFDIVRYDPTEKPVLPLDSDDDARNTFLAVQKYTMTSPERVLALINAVIYVSKNNIPGDFIECGVWRGGSMMAAAITLKNIGVYNRDLYLFDTFEGMQKPTNEDVNLSGDDAETLLKQDPDKKNIIRAYAPLDEVKKNLYSTGYVRDKIHFIKGDVKDTVPVNAPQEISILRLDTDWYESTLHELLHLFPRLSPGGVLMIDDYGHWKGARKAVDEYISDNNIKILLNRIDYTGRIGIKL